jgi:hypothetical protein
MKAIAERARNLALDAFVFAEILLYWPFALLIMKPAKYCDRCLGTHMFPVLDRAMRRIADL